MDQNSKLIHKVLSSLGNMAAVCNIDVALLEVVMHADTWRKNNILHSFIFVDFRAVAIKAAASAPSPEVFSSHNHVGCWRRKAEDPNPG